MFYLQLFYLQRNQEHVWTFCSSQSRNQKYLLHATDGFIQGLQQWLERASQLLSSPSKVINTVWHFQMSSLLHLKEDSTQKHGYLRSLYKVKTLDYSHSPPDLEPKLSHKPHHKTFPLLKQSEDADYGWWIPKLIQRAHVPSGSLLPLHCSHCCANRRICAAAWWKAAGNWSSQRVTCWKDEGVGEGLTLTQFCSNPACIGTNMSGQEAQSGTVSQLQTELQPKVKILFILFLSRLSLLSAKSALRPLAALN